VSGAAEHLLDELLGRHDAVALGDELGDLVPVDAVVDQIADELASVSGAEVWMVV